MNIGEKALSLFDRLILRRPWAALGVLLAGIGLLTVQARHFRLDASADSLVLEHDDDLRYFRQVNTRYGAEEFLVLAYTPAEDLFADAEIGHVKAMADDLRKIERVGSVVTLLDAPLLQSPPITLKELTKTQRTLLSPDTDRAAARREFAESPLFRDLLVSRDLKSTALIVNMKRDLDAEKRYARRIHLREKRYGKTPLTAEETAELKGLEAWYRAYKDRSKRQRHEDIKAVRAIEKKYGSRGRLFLGGVPMVVDDMITFVRDDIRVFGVGMTCFLVLTLGVIFRRARWVFLPVSVCLASVAVMMGVLGLMGWDVTVVSSNFISLQLIMTMEYCIYVIVRYREVAHERPDTSHRDIIRETVRTVFVPVLFSCTTTIAGFVSLIVCDILPVVNFGWMMSLGLCVSMATTFLLFPAAIFIGGKEAHVPKRSVGQAVPTFFARLTEKYKQIIVTVSVALAVATAVGMTRLEVENSFVSYFKKSTEIYKGLKAIDDHLGGTTPLDVVVSFKPADPSVGGAAGLRAVPLAGQADADFDLMEEGAPSDPSTYWFTTDKLETIEKIHDYLESQPAVGKVLSLATLVKMIRPLKPGQSLDNFDLALIFNQFPAAFKKILIDPYVSVENNQTRLLLRVKDSQPTLRRSEFLAALKTDLVERVGLAAGQFRLTSFMVLYNNMLQSLYRSQIKTIGLAVLMLMGMFLVLFRSLKVSVIAIVPNLLSTMTVMGVMGLSGIPLDVMTITIVSISMGIAVDNTIQYIYRFRRELPFDWDYAACVKRCHGSVGNAVFYSCLTIIIGFSILTLSNFIPTILFGLFTALAMAITLAATLTLLPLLLEWLKPFRKSA